MWYPVCKTKEEFEKDWYCASDFGENRNTHLHNGGDYNLRTGGNTDLGYPVYAMFDGELVYYHKNSHPTSSYGRHLVIRCETPLGTRWLHYAHLQEKDFLDGVQTVGEGQMLGRIGASGTKWAHLHFSSFKTDPSTLSRGIDTIATTKNILNKYWEDPELLFNSTESDMPDDGIDKLKEKLAWYQKEYPLEQKRVLDARRERDDVQTQFDIYKNETQREISDLTTTIQKHKTEAEEQRKELKALIAWLAGTLNTTQEVPRVKAEIAKLVEVEDLLVKSRSDNELLQDKNEHLESKLEDSALTIQELEQQLKVAKGLGDATYTELLEAIITKFIKDIKRSVE